MSVDRLQEKIRKLKNPFLLELAPVPELLAPDYAESGSLAEGWGRYCCDLLEAMKGKLPGVRFSFSGFALLGPEGLSQLQQCLKTAASLGYYVLLDTPELWSVSVAAASASTLLGTRSPYPCDGLVIPGYLGSDIWKSFLPYCRDGKKDIFVVVRSGNKSGPEVQDLLTGSRQVYLAATDHVNRSAGDLVGKSGYSRIGVAAGASSQESLKTIRSKYEKLFLLVDGLDYSGCSVKNCSPAFDRLGHGAAICTGSLISGAWRQGEEKTDNTLQSAQDAVDRLRRNISRYVTIL